MRRKLRDTTATGRVSRFETLEGKLMLAAVGTFQRQAEPVFPLYVNAGAAWGNPQTSFGESLARAASGGIEAYENGIAISQAQSVAEVVIPELDFANVPLISTSSAQQTITSSFDDGEDHDGVSAHAQTSITTETEWQYVPPIPGPNTGINLTGSIYVTASGGGNAIGDESRWQAGGEYTGGAVTVLLDNVPIAAISYIYSGYGESLPISAGPAQWSATGFTTDPNLNVIPIDYYGDGINLLINFTVPMGTGLVEVFTSETYLTSSTADRDYHYHAPVTSQSNFGESTTTWFYGTPAPAPAPGGGASLSPAGWYVLAGDDDDGDRIGGLGDFNGDGYVDGDDDVAIAKDHENWASGNGPSRMKEFANNLVAASQSDDIFIVTTHMDEDDSDYSINDLSLREAIALADAHVGEDQIVFAPWVSTITLDEQLVIDSDVMITGPGADILTIDADGNDRVFLINNGVTATISGLTITGGEVNYGGGIAANGTLTLDSVRVTGNYATVDGGGVYANGDVTIRNSRIDDNTAVASGGGIYVNSSSVTTVTDTTIDDNEAVYGAGIYGYLAAGESLIVENSTVAKNTTPSGWSVGGGMLLRGAASGAEATIVNSTVSGNEAEYSGGIRAQEGLIVSLINSTVAYNEGNEGSGIQTASAANVTLHNTIVSENFNGSTNYNLHGAFNSASKNNLLGTNNLSSGISNGLNGNIILSTGTAGLAPLGNYGGPTQTHALHWNSPALENGDDSLAPSTDQRGQSRPFDLPNVFSPFDTTADIGAFEAGDFTKLTVRTDDDTNNSITSSSVFDTLSLREALALSAALAGKETIVFDQSLYSALNPAVITLNDAFPTLLMGQSVEIKGPGADKLIIDADGNNYIFRISLESTLILEGLTLTGANGGGAIQATQADLTVRTSRIIGNSSTTRGGGLRLDDNAIVRIIDSEISDNHAAMGGGGIYDDQSNDMTFGVHLEIVNSTISGNTTNGTGGGLRIKLDDSSSHTTNIVNSTIAYNTATDGGGIYSSSDDENGVEFIWVHNTIIAENSDSSGDNDVVGPDFNPLSSYNLIGRGGSGGISDGVLHNIVLDSMESAGLDGLAFNGGATRTHRLQDDSDALNAGYDDIAEEYDLVFDQRGLNFGRFVDAVDIGAFERADDDFDV